MCYFTGTINKFSVGEHSENKIVGPDVFFEIIEPPELEYTYRLKPAKDFGAPFVSLFIIEASFFLHKNYQQKVKTEKMTNKCYVYKTFYRMPAS